MRKLSSTQLLRLSQCPKAYQYAYVDQLVPKPRTVKYVLRRGIWVHAAIEEWYHGRDWEPVLDLATDYLETAGVAEEEVQKLRSDVNAIMQGYVIFYKDEDLVIKTVEEELCAELGDVTISATLDSIAENAQGTWIVEHKSTSQIPSSTWRQIDPQTAIQYYVARENGYRPDGILFNYIYTGLASVPRVKKDGKEFYANSAVTTNLAFEQGAVKLVDPEPGYVEHQRGALVNDAKYFQRYYVLRPEAHIVETFRDLAYWVGQLDGYEARSHYPRSPMLKVCSQFCSYGELCATEYLQGHPALGLRADWYDVGEQKREGIRRGTTTPALATTERFNFHFYNNNNEEE